MSMSWGVQAYRDRDEPEYQRYLRLWEATKAIQPEVENLSLIMPRKVQVYFPDLDDPESALEVDVPNRQWSGECSEHIEINVSQIPKGAHMIRFSVHF